MCENAILQILFLYVIIKKPYNFTDKEECNKKKKINYFFNVLYYFFTNIAAYKMYGF